MNSNATRQLIKDFYSSGEMSQNEIARQAQVPRSTFSDFMQKKTDLSKAQLKRVLKVIKADEFNPKIVGSRLRTMLLKRAFTSQELLIVAREIGKPLYDAEAQ
jgi:DNA-binding LacI/PurR family transcriptional regulator